MSEPGEGAQDGVSFRHDGSGTDEATWRGWPRLERLPALDWSGLDHVVVVAAHPDDETLGAAGLIAEASRRGVAVDVVVATLGEASHPRSSTITPERLSRWRAREVTDSVGLLAPRAVLHLLHLPDGELQQHVPAVTARVAALAGAGSLVVAPGGVGAVRRLVSQGS